MAVSVFDLFSIGIGPSSSHTVGPMKAAQAFVSNLSTGGYLAHAARLKIELFGSLAYTGKGHGTDSALVMGLEGDLPDTVDPDTIKSRFETIAQTQILHVNREATLSFSCLNDIIFNYTELLPAHTNGMRFSAYDSHGTELLVEIYYSIGGGFILTEAQASQSEIIPSYDIPYPFSTTKELIAHCENSGLTIQELMRQNEICLRPESEVNARLLQIYDVMQACIDKGSTTTGILPGGLNVKRRGPGLFQKLILKGMPKSFEHTDTMSWLNLFAIAVNEENAACGRVVTAPTNGAAGVIPAVLHYYLTFYPQSTREEAIDFLLVAGAIAILYKKGASISGAEVGCQGEVGVACSMAAAALTAIQGGTIYQVENAAEIAMEHHLGMTCDPIGGLVQIPCIERNAMGAVKAVNASRLALLGDGTHFVSLDKVIATMKQTGKDMMSIYKETSLGGLAANIPEC
jgi:L-serine dehydratase